MKITKKPIDLTMFESLLDTCGDMPLEDNLIHAFEYLQEKKFRKGKILRSQKVKIHVSKVVNDHFGDPQRYDSPKIATISRLLREWEYAFGESFSKESLEKAQEKEKLKMRFLEKEGERRSAWGAFSTITRFQNQAREEYEFNKSISHLDYNDQVKKKEEREKTQRSRSNNLVIG